MTHKSIYFCGNKISDYGIQNKRLDYRTLSKAFDAVLVNDITKLFYSSVNGEYIEPEQENGIIDNSDEIEEIQEQIDALQDQIDTLEDARDDGNDEQTDKQIDALQEQIDTLENKIEELEEEQENSYNPDIMQYFIVSDNGADIIKRYTNDPLYYIDFLDCYIWGVTHWGTSWDYVLTDVVLEIEEDNEQ